MNTKELWQLIKPPGDNERMNLETFKERKLDGDTTGVSLLKARTLAIKAVGDDDPDSEIPIKRLFVISDGSVDRMGDTINVDGWDFKDWINSPVIPFGHDYHSPPVAMGVPGVASGKAKGDPKKGVWVDEVKSQVLSVAGFPHRDICEFGNMIGRMVASGFLRSCSVGFDPIKWKWSEDEARPDGIDFAKQTLLEWSIVPVPANANALAKAMSDGIDVAPLRAWACKSLDEGGCVIVPRETLEDIRGLADSKQAVSVAVDGLKDAGEGEAAEGDGSDDIEIKINPDPEPEFKPELGESKGKLEQILGPDFADHGDDLLIEAMDKHFDITENLYTHHNAETGAVNCKAVERALVGMCYEAKKEPISWAIYEHLRAHLDNHFPDSKCNVELRHIEASVLSKFKDTYMLDPLTSRIEAMTQAERAAYEFKTACESVIKHKSALLDMSESDKAKAKEVLDVIGKLFGSTDTQALDSGEDLCEGSGDETTYTFKIADKPELEPEESGMSFDPDEVKALVLKQLKDERDSKLGRVIDPA